MSNRLVFINPPSPFLQHDRGAPPLGLLWLAAEVRAAGFEALVWDLTGDHSLADQFGCDPETFIARGNILLPSWIPQSPDDTIFAITATSAQYHSARNLLFALKWTNPHWQVIIGGPHVSALPHEAVADGFDTVFAGECDLCLPQWLDGVRVRGVVEGQAPRDLDTLPHPARDLVDLRSYCANVGDHSGWATTVHMSRGCPY